MLESYLFQREEKGWEEKDLPEVHSIRDCIFSRKHGYILRILIEYNRGNKLLEVKRFGKVMALAEMCSILPYPQISMEYSSHKRYAEQKL